MGNKSFKFTINLPELEEFVMWKNKTKYILCFILYLHKLNTFYVCDCWSDKTKHSGQLVLLISWLNTILVQEILQRCTVDPYVWCQRKAGLFNGREKIKTQQLCMLKSVFRAEKKRAFFKQQCQRTLVVSASLHVWFYKLKLFFDMYDSKWHTFRFWTDETSYR